MTKHAQGKANQQLYFAKLHLQAMEDAEQNDNLLNKKAVLAANREAAIFQLVSAYKGFLWEVAQTYDLEFLETDQLLDVKNKARAKGVEVSELNRFETLESNKKSWLSELLFAWDQIKSFDPIANAVVAPSSNLNSIEIIRKNEFEALDVLQLWRQKLYEEVASIRELLGEW